MFVVTDKALLITKLQDKSLFFHNHKWNDFF